MGSDTKTSADLDVVRRLGTVPVWHPTKPDAADVLGIGRALAYAMARQGEIPTIRLGKRVVVPVPALLAMLACEGGERDLSQPGRAGLRVSPDTDSDGHAP